MVRQLEGWQAAITEVQVVSSTEGPVHGQHAGADKMQVTPAVGDATSQQVVTEVAPNPPRKRQRRTRAHAEDKSTTSKSGNGSGKEPNPTQQIKQALSSFNNLRKMVMDAIHDVDQADCEARALFTRLDTSSICEDARARNELQSLQSLIAQRQLELSTLECRRCDIRPCGSSRLC
jgi:hypothetical protein